VFNSGTTNGNGDMPAKNIVETTFHIIFYLIGCPLFSGILGNLSSLLSNIGAESRDFDNKVKKLRRLMLMKDIPIVVQQRVLFFLDYKFQRTAGVNEAELIEGLPQSLKEGLAKCTIGVLIANIPFFECCSDHVLERILDILTYRSFLDGDSLVLEGEIGNEMFLIDNGRVEVTSAKRDIVYATLSNGDYLGESCLLKVY
jgi:hypothetical protein